jgi:hypothetical protein
MMNMGKMGLKVVVMEEECTIQWIYSKCSLVAAAEVIFGLNKCEAVSPTFHPRCTFLP